LFFGVATTGIYCIPSCGARKPLRKNTLFFPDAEAARAAGLRPCRKCRPDDFARGADLVLETVEAVVEEIRANPGAFADARAVVKRLGFGPTRAFELFRLHYHATPAEILLRARLDAAKTRLAGGKDSLARIAEQAGFESLSGFHENFRARNGMTPADWRALAAAGSAAVESFRVDLPEGYLLGYLRRSLGRDTHSVTERLVDDAYVAGHRFAQGPGLLKLHLAPDAVRVECPPGAALEAHRLVIGLLGLEQDAAAFARLAKKLGLARLVAGRAELRATQTASAFDGLMWAVLGQQINMPFACLLRRRLTELAGTVAGAHDGETLYAPPSPEAVAALEPEALLPHQFSRQKADYVISIARLVASRNLDLEALHRGSATRAERALLAVRGLGPWSVNYVMMRALGFADCVPYGDTGVTSGLKALFDLEERPDVDATRRLMAVFAPHRSLAVMHLWQFERPEPA
jgi:AraC family transcriptional regulator of adaptative response / DNA-3-methyladenine glycosylase II